LEKNCKPFVDKNSIVEIVSSGKRIFRAVVGGKTIWEGAQDECGSLENAQKIASETVGHQILLADINDVLAWLIHENPQYSDYLYIERYHHQRWTKMIAKAVIYHDDREFGDQLISEAEAALAKLGWTIEDGSDGSLDFFKSKLIGEISGHQRLRAIQRVGIAMSALRKE